jgi:FkbM family methyltransferase
LRALDLQLLQTASVFDLSQRSGRRASNAALSTLFVQLHGLTRPDVVFEIGAHEAAFSCRVRSEVPDAKIYAFEANPHNYERWRSQASLAERRVEYLHLAVSNRPGEAAFFIQKAHRGKAVSPNVGSNSMLKRLGNVDQERIFVPATSVTAFVNERELRGTFTAWIDVEGAIMNVLLGMTANLDNFAMIFCEVEERAQWKGQWLWPDVLRFLTGHGFTPVARDFEYVGQHNVLFLRNDVFARPHVRDMLAKHYAALGRAVPHHAEPQLAARPE